MQALENGESLREAGGLRRTIRADLTRDQRQVDVPPCFKTTERRQRGRVQGGRRKEFGLPEAFRGLA